MHSRKPAFTLIELLLSMGIIGTLSSIIMAAVNPTAQFSAAHDAQRRVMQRGLHNSVQQYIVDVGAYPGDKPITTTPLNICRQTVTSPTCINMDNLVSDGYIASLPVDISETDPLLTGYQVALVESRPTVTSVYVGTGINPAPLCDVAFTPPAFFVDGNGANGINKNVANGAMFPSIALVGSTLNVAWQETAVGQPSQIRVAAYNGNNSAPAWSFVDGNGVNGINKDTARSATNVEITEFNGKLYAIWAELNATSVSQVRVKVYSGGVWTFVDGNGANGLNKDTLRSTFTPQLSVFNSKLYATWIEVNAAGQYQVRVRVYNGNDGSPTWTFVDGNGANGINKNTALSATYSRLTSFNGKLYASWYERNGSAVEQVRVAVYNGNDGSPSWSFVDGNGANGLNIDVNFNSSLPQLIAFNNKLYLGWSESIGATYQVHVKVYNGNDGAPSWSLVDGSASGLNVNAAGFAQYFSLAVSDGELFAQWTEAFGGSGQIRAAVYNGNDSSPDWTMLDGGGATGLNKDTTKGAVFPKGVSLSNDLYLTWHETNGSSVNQIRVVTQDACN